MLRSGLGVEGRPAPGAAWLAGLRRICFGIIPCLILALYVGPDVVGLLLAGSARHLPGTPSLASMWSSRGYNRTLPVGESRFANPALYGSGAPFSLPAAARAAYFEEGYLLLRGLLPSAVVAALRDELFKAYSFELEKNAHHELPFLRDFLVFSPLGAAAAELLQGGVAHLLRSVLHFRPTVVPLQRVSRYHYDWLECAEDLLVQNVSDMVLKFNIALFENMPAMWLVNQSSFRRLVLRRHNASTWAQLRATPQGPPLTQEEMQEVALRPLLQLGDVLVHAATLPHQSPAAATGSLLGFLSPSYAAPAARCLGRPASNRECESGADASAEAAEVARIASVPIPDCFPRAFPPASQRAGPARVAFRANFWTSPLRRVASSALTRWLFVKRGHAADTAGTAEPPQTQVVDVGEEGGGRAGRRSPAEGGAAATGPGRPVREL